MWTKSGMSVPESITVSGIGLCVVFITLIVLALAILFFSKIFKATGFEKGKKKTGSNMEETAGKEKDEEDIMAILVATVSEAVNEPAERFKITDIREVKNIGE